MTGSNSTLNILRKRLLCSLAGLLLACSFAAKAQQLELARHLAFASPAAVSIDRLGNFYFADQRRTVYQFNAAGEPMQTYSPPISGTVSTIEARNGTKILLFYYDQQRLVFLDRFLRELSTVNLANLAELGNGDLFGAATFSGDDQLWLYNESNFTLSKIDSRTYKPLVSTPLNLLLNRQRFDVRFLREYQNNLYLVEKNTGVLVFDNMGNYRKTLPFPGLDYVGFLGEELYYLKDNQLHFFHLYNGAERQVDLLPGNNYKNALVGEEFLYLFSEKGVDIFRFQK